VSDARLRFRARVAANVLSVAARERALEADLLVGRAASTARSFSGKAIAAPPPVEKLRSEVEELNKDLAQRIRDDQD